MMSAIHRQPTFPSAQGAAAASRPSRVPFYITFALRLAMALLRPEKHGTAATVSRASPGRSVVASC